MNDDALFAALDAAENANTARRPCQVCVALDQMSDQAKVRVERALGGTIGQTKLAAILTANGFTVGERAVSNHRSEGHTS